MTAQKITQHPTARHPLAGKSMSGAEMIIQVLADEGVDTIFGYSGGAILPTYDAIFRYHAAHDGRQIRLIVPANEQGAGFMAAGYARSSGKVGVFLVTSGPGATNSVTPIRDCMAREPRRPFGATSVPRWRRSGSVPVSFDFNNLSVRRRLPNCEACAASHHAYRNRP